MTGFRTTRWSVVAAARDPDDAIARSALAELCSSYWYPLYAFLRRDGHPEAEALDLVQGFVARLLEKRDVDGAEPDRGRFRSYLLGALRHYVRNVRRAEAAERRGGALETVEIDGLVAEQRYRIEPADEVTAERLFERRWVLDLLDRVVATLAAEYAERGRAEAFELLKPHLAGSRSALSYSDAAATLGTTESAIKVTVHRMRRRLREILVGEVAHTMSDPREVDAEIAHLFTVLG